MNENLEDRSRLSKFLHHSVTIGLIIGIILGTLNIFYLGLLANRLETFFQPIHLVVSKLFFLISSPCSGEGCWGLYILIGNIDFIIYSILIAVFISINYKYFYKKNNSVTKLKIIIYDALFIFLILYGVIFTIAVNCIQSENCIIKTIELTNRNSLCQFVNEGTWFTFKTKIEKGKINFPGYSDMDLGPNGCYTKLAVKRNDKTICDELGDYKQHCYERLIHANPSPELCDEIDRDLGSGFSIKDECLVNVAIKNHDAAKCNLVGGEGFTGYYGYKIICQAAVNNNPNDCNILSPGDLDSREMCFDFFNKNNQP